MTTKNQFKTAVLQLKDNKSDVFENLALDIFQYQSKVNPIYKAYIKNLKINPKKIDRIEKIPFLPISFFKTQKIISGEIPTQVIFESSGTTGQQTSKHFLADTNFYELISQKNFEHIYGDLTNYHFLALLPSYLERKNSSLVYMVQSFIYKSHSDLSGFFLKNDEKMENLFLKSLNDDRKVVIWGVTFALLELAKKSTIFNEHPEKFIIIETGGMKGTQKELLRQEVHEQLKEAFKQEKIHSEYGMTELMSQSYSLAEGWFSPSPTMRIFLREVNDPFSILPHFSVGQQHKSRNAGVNIIDLANIDTCCFIETQDLGSYSKDYTQFSIDGRFDNSDIRGCNLMGI